MEITINQNNKLIKVRRKEMKILMQENDFDIFNFNRWTKLY